VALVAVASAVTTATVITLGILGLSFIVSVFGAVLTILCVVTYLVGAAKLTQAVGGENETGLRVARLARQVAGVMILNTLFTGCYAVIGSGNDFMPLQIVIVDLLMPVGLSAGMLLLLRFIRGSFERLGERRRKSATMRSRGGRGTTSPRSTASVSPATNFTETSSTRMGALAI
jgi:hypothetical protein